MAVELQMFRAASRNKTENARLEKPLRKEKEIPVYM
jgi:hypothetical protein